MVRVMGYSFHTLASKFPSAIFVLSPGCREKMGVASTWQDLFPQNHVHCSMSRLVFTCNSNSHLQLSFSIFRAKPPGQECGNSAYLHFQRRSYFSTENLWPHTPWAAQKTFDLTSLVPYKHGGRSKSHLPVATPNSHRNWHVGGGKWKVGIGK